MNNINITVELCAEDRARLDKITALLADLATPIKMTEDDPLRKQLERVVASAAQTAAEPAEEPQDEAEAPTPTDTPATVETPATAEEPTEAVAEEPAEESKPEVTIEMLKSKVIKLAAKAELKEKVRELVQAYASKVTDIPEDKWAEVYMRLDELEG